MIDTNNIRNELKELNTYFLKNNRNGIKINNKSYIYKRGQKSILIVASHAVKQYREKKLKKSDYLTGPLAIYLAEKYDCSYFIRTYNDFDDPNYPLGVTLETIDNEYLNALLEFIRKTQPYIVIDLHGCTDKKLYDCSIWSDNFNTCEEPIVRLFKDSIEKSNLSIDMGSEYLGGQVTRQSSLLTNAFQIEVKRKIRSLQLENAEFLVSFLEAMEDAIFEADNYIRKRKK